MDFTTFKYDVIENSYVVVAVIKNMQLVAEMRFYPMGNHVAQNILILLDVLMTICKKRFLIKLTN